MKSLVTTILAIIAIAEISGLSAAAQTGVLSVSSYGAKCDGSPDDTAAFQAAAAAAHALYSQSPSLGPVTVTFAGNCVINGNVTVLSGVHWRGYGLILVTSPQQVLPTFYAKTADEVEWDHVDIHFNTTLGNGQYTSGIGWFDAVTDNATSPHNHVRIENCHISGAGWGIEVSYAQNANGPGLTDVEIANNVITSDSAYTQGEGINVSGKVTNIRIHDNTIKNRNGPGIGLTSSGNGTYVLSQASVTDNTLLEDIIGIDISGATNVDVIGNFVQATTPAGTSQNPAFRQIWFQGVVPVNVRTLGNYFENATGASYAAKIDPEVLGNSSWPALNTIFQKNTVAGPNNLLYFRGNSIVVDGNTFNSSGTLFVDYDGTDGVATSNVLIGTNRWIGNASIIIGANPSLIQNVQMASQAATGTVTITNGGNVKTIPN